MSDVNIGPGGPQTDPVPYVEGPPVGDMSAVKVEPQGNLPDFKDPTAGATTQSPNAPKILDDLSPVGSADAAEPSVFDSAVVKAMVTARANGKTWGQINDTLQTNAQTLLKQGVPQDQIDQQMGFKSGDLAGVETLIDAHAAKAAEQPAPKPDDQQGWFNHIVTAFAGGLQQTGVGEASGAAGEAAGYKMPDLTPSDQGMMDRIAGMLGVQSESIAAMSAGAALGSTVGPIGTVVGGLAGYWLDDNFRRAVTDLRTQGNLPIPELVARMVTRTWESTKSTATVGAAMAVGGPAAGIAEGMGLNAVGSAVVATSAELAAMTGAGVAFTGSMGTSQDFWDNAVTLALLHTTGVPGKAKELTMSSIKTAHDFLAANKAATNEDPAAFVARAQAVNARPKLQVDNPGGEWLQNKIEDAQSARAKAPPNTYKANLGTSGGVTGYFSAPLNLDPQALKNIPGAMGEEAVRDQNVADGKFDATGRGPILIHVREDGQPFVVEGNHRLAEAVRTGQSSIPAEVKYLRGAEKIAGSLNPDNLPYAKTSQPIDPVAAPEPPRVMPDIKQIIPPKPEEATGSLEDHLHGLTTRGEADRIQMMQYLASLPDQVGQAPAEGGYQSFDEKAYNHIERPDAVPLDPTEQKLYDQTIQPLRDVHAQLFQRAKGILNGVEQAQLDPNYVPRLAQEKNFEQDRLAGGQEAIPFMGGQGKLSQSTGALRTPTFHTIVDQDGNRVVVSEGKRGGLIVYHDGDKPKPIDGEITDPKAEDPKARVDLRAGTTFTDDKNVEWKVVRSNTKEIEDNTTTKYHKSAVGNLADSILKLNRVIRNKELADAVTSAPEWLDHATKKGGNNAAEAVAAGWQEVHIPGYEGWLIDPETREKLEDFTAGGPGGRAWKINKIAVGSLFALPFGEAAHLKNLAGMTFIGRGFDNLNVARGWRTGVQAMGEVNSLGPVYRAILNAKGSLISSGVGKESMTEFLMNKFGQEIPKDPKRFGPIIKALGLNTPAQWASNFSTAMSKDLFRRGDILYVQRVLELQEKGLSLEDAINETEKYLPTYRSYSRTLGQRWLSKGLYNPNITSFGRFDAGKVKAVANMITSLKDGMADRDPVAVKDALGRFAAMAVLVGVVAPLMNAIVQKATGNKNATFGLGGTAQFAEDLKDYATNDPTFDKLRHLVQGQWIPAIGTHEVYQQARNTDDFRKEPIGEGNTGQQLLESGEHAAENMVSPSGAAADFGKFIRGGVGIRDNKPYTPGRQQIREIQRRWPKDTSLIQKIEGWFHH